MIWMILLTNMGVLLQEPFSAVPQARVTEATKLAAALHSSRWILHEPTPPQAEFLYLPDREALYGGAAGGGKSDALLMGGLQFADVPGYAGIIFRRTFAELNLPDGLIPRSYGWLGGTGARWNDSKKQWKFPSGGVLAFGYLERYQDVQRYQSSAYQYIGFDELTQFGADAYEYMRSRLRRLKVMLIPTRMRSATNPGGPGHAWVHNRFVVPGARYPYVPARLDDNPYLDQRDYEESLSELDPILRMQLREGKWVLDPRGKPYNPAWWQKKNRYDAGDKGIQGACIGRWLSWDTANKDEDHHAFTARAVFEMTPDYRVVLRDVWKTHTKGAEVGDLIAKDAGYWNEDGKLQGIIVEDEASGIIAIQSLINRMDWISELVIPFNPGKFGDKLYQRPLRAALWCTRDCVLLPWPNDAAPWLLDFSQDLFGFPEVIFKDTIDAFNQGIIFLENLLAEGWRGRGGNLT